MIGYIKATRLPAVAMAILLTLAAFRMRSWNTSGLGLIMLFVVVVGIATMYQNDLRDRWHDAKKGKVFARDHYRGFLTMTIVLWAISIALAFLLWSVDSRFVALSLAMILVGLTYSETRGVLLLPASLVGLTFAGSVLFAGWTSSNAILLFAFTAILVFGREILKDLDDYPLDAGYKKTLPIVKGPLYAQTVAGFAIALATCPLFLVSPTTWLGGAIIILAASFLIIGHDHRFCRLILEIGMTTAVGCLLIFGI